ncbi:hypothetical protein [Kaarinaea lacus]
MSVIKRFLPNPHTVSYCNRVFSPLTVIFNKTFSRSRCPRFWPCVELITAWLILLPACTVINSAAKQVEPIADQPLSQQFNASTNYWWYVRVKMNWPEGQPIAWYKDVLLAHKLFKPVLLNHAHDIQLWRFHRRAGRDNSGHRFSFIFYAREATAMAIFNDLAENSLVTKLITANSVEKLVLHEANKAPNSAIEATSDNKWSQPMQRAWPYFAMGVSQAWLSLIDQHIASMATNAESAFAEEDVEALLEFYQRIDEKLVATWETEGGHALLHHLNALFGYGEVAIYERRMIRF